MRFRWLAMGGIGFSLIATTWTAVTLVAPSVVATSLSTTPNLRTADPFAPRMVVAANRLPDSAQIADDPTRIIAEEIAAANRNDDAAARDQMASGQGSMPSVVRDGAEIAQGVPLRRADQIAPSLGPVLASLTPYAHEPDIAAPRIHTVTAVNANPAAPEPPDAPVEESADADTTVTGSIPETIPLPPMRDVALAEAPSEQETAQIPLPPQSPIRRPGPVLASLDPAEQRPAPSARPAPAISSPSLGNRTAIYDIAAHTVYLPNGEKLEAHSGLGGLLDDPGSVHVKNRGATPPHTYDLSPREQLFHGVAALRLTPSGGGSVYGRVGLLAHTYMLGPRGDSNGCVSFKDYSRFLRAYRSGEITKLAVVPSLSRSGSQVASRSKRSWWWFASSTD
ncbi:hypothetical protein LMIY3S_05707 [Labrys miyagiensis]